MNLALKRYLKDGSFLAYHALDRIGLHVLPKTFYSPVPDYSWLTRNRELWTSPVALHGVDWDLERQMSWLDGICRPYYHEVAHLEFYRGAIASGIGAGYGEIESQVLHCFVRSCRPSRIIEIGGGISTLCARHAADLNVRDGYPDTQITSIEPYPKPGFEKLAGVRHVRQVCQGVPLSLFDCLGPGDLLFVDCSHAVKVGSDVVRIYLEIIPRLAAGVYIHAHDIYLPYLYPRDALSAYFGAQETVLLAGLMTDNPRLEVLSCLSALHYALPARLSAVLTDYRPQPNDQGLATSATPEGHFPSSCWMRSRYRRSEKDL